MKRTYRIQADCPQCERVDTSLFILFRGFIIRDYDHDKVLMQTFCMNPECEWEIRGEISHRTFAKALEHSLPAVERP